MAMPIAASTVEIVLFVMVVVALGLLAAGAFRRTGDAAERTTPLGSQVPKVPEQDFKRPRDEGG
jgi:hypothetical protein